MYQFLTSEGCGTYNDPYVIDSEKSATFEKIATFLKTGNGSQLPTITLPLDYDSYCEGTGDSRTYSIAKLTSGSRWCTNKSDHAVFTYDSTSDADNYTYTYTPDGGTATTVKWPVKAVRLYLESAYYVISGDITLTASFPGLGGVLESDNANASGNYAFRGVIIGKNTTITNNSVNPLISISNGSVVKNLTVVQNVDVTLTQETTGSANAAFGYKTPVQTGNSMLGCSYYGGIIGEIMGGDNIIDNCYVQQTEGKKITLNGTNGNLCPVGSYVGVVVFGGLIFKNMAATTANNNAKVFKVYYGNDTTNLNAKSSKGAIYVNPYVGRVINGYAVNETTTQFSMTEDGHYHDEDGTARTAADGTALTQHSLKNTTKHYTIADINKNETNKLEVSKVPTSTTDDGIINIPNSQAFFVLSLITQSLSGTAQKAGEAYQASLSYGIYTSNNISSIYGKSHNADYTKVGTATESTDSDYALATTDTAENTAVPYVVSRYTTKVADVQTSRIERQIVGDYSGDADALDNETSYYIAFVNGNNPDYKYFQNNIDTGGRIACSTVNDPSAAALWHFEKQDDGKYKIYTFIDDNKNYIYMDTPDKDKAILSTDKSTSFSITKSGSNYYIKNDSTKLYFNKWNGFENNVNGVGGYSSGTVIRFRKVNEVEVPYVILGGYNARCVTSTAGYYDINLTGNEPYYLPDSFRGIGSVGYYDHYDNTVSNHIKDDRQLYRMNVDCFNGNGKTIDEDIYLNRYCDQKDNFFDSLHRTTGCTQDYQSMSTYNTDLTIDKNPYYNLNSNTENHGIGLFDSVFMRDESSGFKNFTLTGSLNTENYSLGTSATGEKVEKAEGGLTDGKVHWLATGGVCGASPSASWCNFEKVTLSNLSVSGATQTGGLLGHSGLNGIAQKILITECNAEELSVEIRNCIKIACTNCRVMI